MVFIKLFMDYLDAIEPLGDAERGRLFTALMKYARTGEAPRLSGNERFVFPMMRAQIDRDEEEFQAYQEKQKENGKKGGRPKSQAFSEKPKKPTGFFENPKNLYKDKDDNKDNDKGKDKDNGKDDDDDKDIARAREESVVVVLREYQSKIGNAPSPKCSEELARYASEMGADCCLRAFDIAVDAGKVGKEGNPWAYIQGILRKKLSQGVRSLEDWDRVERQRAAGGQGKAAGSAPGQSVQASGERIRKNGDWLDEFLRQQEGSGNDA